jgi:hypothetical protein
MDRVNTVFGRIIHNYKWASQMEGSQDTIKYKENLPICKIVDCGELKGEDKFDEGTADFLSYYDKPLDLKDPMSNMITQPNVASGGQGFDGISPFDIQENAKAGDGK